MLLVTYYTLNYAGIIGRCLQCWASYFLTIKPAENVSEMHVYTIWACMATLGGVT